MPQRKLKQRRKCRYNQQVPEIDVTRNKYLNQSIRKKYSRTYKRNRSWRTKHQRIWGSSTNSTKISSIRSWKTICSYSSIYRKIDMIDNLEICRNYKACNDDLFIEAKLIPVWVCSQCTYRNIQRKTYCQICRFSYYQNVDLIVSTFTESKDQLNNERNQLQLIDFISPKLLNLYELKPQNQKYNTLNSVDYIMNDGYDEDVIHIAKKQKQTAKSKLSMTNISRKNCDKYKRKDVNYKKTRIAIINENKCKPRKCQRECKRNCPVNRQGKRCVEVSLSSKVATLRDILCTGCGICVQKCPFKAIKIINIPKSIRLESISNVIHKFGRNSYQLHGIPIPAQNKVLGIIGQTGIGKSTALKLLRGRIKPNLGNFENPPGWEEVCKYFRGSELENYYRRILEEELESMMKPQYIYHILKKVKTGKTVKSYLKKKDDRNIYKHIVQKLNLDGVLHKQICDLSGGELQRFAIAIICVRNVDIYMFDEPCSYLDIKQRLNAANIIRELISAEEERRREMLYGRPKSAYVVCVEHDLSILEYLSDSICIMYGISGAYGVISMPFAVREGINIFLSGYIPKENMRFRDTEINWFEDKKIETNEYKDMDDILRDRYGYMLLLGYIRKETGNVMYIPIDIIRLCLIFCGEYDIDKIKIKEYLAYRDKLSISHIYPEMTKTLHWNSKRRNGAFKLMVEPGFYCNGEIVVLFGENGTGKTTFMKLMVGLLKPDDETVSVPELSVSYKPQKITPTFQHSVQTLLHKRIRSIYMNPQFINDVIKPLKLMDLYDKIVTNLSGGELQRVAIALALGTRADVYFLDEPSAHLDAEQRIIAAKVIKRFIVNSGKSAFVAEHDFMIATYLADSIIIFEGKPSEHAIARRPQSLIHGINKYLRNLDVTFRRDPINWRPRINKLKSIKDIQQKRNNNYFYMNESD